MVLTWHQGLLTWHNVVWVLVVWLVVILLVNVRWMLLNSGAMLGSVVLVMLVVCVVISFVVWRCKKQRVTRYLWRKIAHVQSVCVMLVV